MLPFCHFRIRPISDNTDLDSRFSLIYTCCRPSRSYTRKTRCRKWFKEIEIEIWFLVQGWLNLHMRWQLVEVNILILFYVIFTINIHKRTWVHWNEHLANVGLSGRWLKLGFFIKKRPFLTNLSNNFCKKNEHLLMVRTDNSSKLSSPVVLILMIKPLKQW